MRYKISLNMIKLQKKIITFKMNWVQIENNKHTNVLSDLLLFSEWPINIKIYTIFWEFFFMLLI